jgi:hypothetical protein
MRVQEKRYLFNVVLILTPRLWITQDFPYKFFRCQRYGHLVADCALKLNKKVWVKKLGTTPLEVRNGINGKNHIKANHSKGGLDSQSKKGEGYTALLIPQEVDNTKNTVYADAQSHQEIGTKDSKDAPLQSLGIDGIGKSLLNLAKREVYVRFIPY